MEEKENLTEKEEESKENEETKKVEDAEKIENIEEVKDIKESEGIKTTGKAENVEEAEENVENTENTENKDVKKEKKLSVKKIIVIAILASVLICVVFFTLGNQKKELSKSKYEQNYNYSMAQEVEKFKIKVTGKYKKDDTTIYQCDVTPVDDTNTTFKVETSVKPATKTITGAKYIYTVSYPKYEEKVYSYYETEYGNSVSDKKIKEFNSTKYIDKYYDEHFVAPSKK